MNTEALKAAREHNPKNPGKFEMERKATVYYWHCMLDGDGEAIFDHGGEDAEVIATYFDVAEDEAKEFGLTGKWFVVEENSQGFVYGWETSNPKDVRNPASEV